MRSLDSIPWSTCVLTNRAIICSQFILVNKTTENSEVVRKQFMYSTTTPTFHESPLFKDSINQEKKTECLEIDSLKGIGKI